MLKIFLFCMSLVSFSAISGEVIVEDKKVLKEYKFYLGGFLGSSSSEETYESDLIVEGDQAVFGVYGGYRFSPAFAIEVSAAIALLENEREGVAKVEDTALTIISISPKFNFHFTNSFSVYGKVGLALVILTENYEDDSDFWDYDETDLWYGGGIQLGVGAEYLVSSNLEFRIGLDYIESELESDDDNHRFSRLDVDEEFSMVTAGLSYQF